MDIPFIIGQIIGVIAMAVLFVSYQFKEPKTLLTIQCIGVFLMCVHYLLIEAVSGLALNIVCLLRNLAYANKDKKFLSGKWIPVLFAVAVGAVGIFFWEAYYSIFIVVPLVINTLFLSLPDTQKLRYSILVTSPLVFIYDAFVISVGGMANESLTVISSVIGIVRHRKNQKNENK